MRNRWLLWVGGALAPILVTAQTPSPAARSEACQQLDNRVLGPRSSNRPLPLLSGDATHGFHTACTVPWQTLSPRNEALPVTGCFHGSLLQISNDSACGSGTGRLWVSSRWVMTSAELKQPALRAATCQQLDTGAWAGTRAFDFDCVPQKRALKDQQLPTDSASPARTSTPAASRSTAAPASTSAPASTAPPANTAPVNAATGPQR